MNESGLKALLSNERGNRVLIFPHISPDGDTLGSAIGLRHLLLENGIEGIIVLGDEIPLNLAFLVDKLPKGALITPDEVNFEYKTVFAVDCAEPKLFNNRQDLIKEGLTLVNIDHHHTNKHYGDLNIVDTLASSTGELVFSIYEMFDVEADVLAAEALYTAIVTDTGSFRYSNTRPYTFKVCSKLMEQPFDFNELNVSLFQNKPFEKVKLQNEIMSNLKRYYDNKVALVTLDDTLKSKLGFEDYDTDGVVEAVRDIEGIEVVVFLKTTNDGKVKGSMRAKSYFNVSEIAGQFGGGGHIKAAGFTSSQDIESLEKDIIEAIGKRMGAGA